jgi:ECF sigma factor
LPPRARTFGEILLALTKARHEPLQRRDSDMPCLYDATARKLGVRMNVDIGDLIRRVGANEPGAQDALFAAAYDELRKLARSRLRNVGRNTVLDTTTLVHESYLRFV